MGVSGIWDMLEILGPANYANKATDLLDPLEIFPIDSKAPWSLSVILCLLCSVVFGLAWRDLVDLGHRGQQGLQG